jgi:hypothetical protein
MRQFFRVEIADVVGASVQRDLSAPSFAAQPAPALQVNTEKTAFAIALRRAKVLHVHLARYVSQIVQAIVRAVAVKVVDMFRWPFPSHHQPNGAVFLESYGTNSDAHVACLGRFSGAITSGMFMRCGVCLTPAQAPVIGVVVEQFKKKRSNVSSFHPASLAVMLHHRRLTWNE